MAFAQAIIHKDVEQLRYCLEYGVAFESPVDIYRLIARLDTPLCLASRVGFLKGIELLLEHGMKPNDPCEQNITPLHLATYTNSLSIVRLLCDHGADVNARTENVKDTPLHYATIYGSLDMCKELVERGADIRALNRDNQMPFHSCLDRLHLLEFFFQLDSTLVHACNMYGMPPICEVESVELVRLCIRYGANVHASNINGVTALHRACVKNRPLEMIQILIEHGADVNAVTSYGQTPFGIAWSGSDETLTPEICILLEHGARPYPMLQYFPKGRLTALQERYKMNVFIQLVVACIRFKRTGSSLFLLLLPVELIRVLHTFLR